MRVLNTVSAQFPEVSLFWQRWPITYIAAGFITSFNTNKRAKGKRLTGTTQEVRQEINNRMIKETPPSQTPGKSMNSILFWKSYFPKAPGIIQRYFMYFGPLFWRTFRCPLKASTHPGMITFSTQFFFSKSNRYIAQRTPLTPPNPLISFGEFLETPLGEQFRSLTGPPSTNMLKQLGRHVQLLNQLTRRSHLGKRKANDVGDGVDNEVDDEVAVVADEPLDTDSPAPASSPTPTSSSFNTNSLPNPLECQTSTCSLPRDVPSGKGFRLHCRVCLAAKSTIIKESPIPTRLRRKIKKSKKVTDNTMVLDEKDAIKDTTDKRKEGKGLMKEVGVNAIEQIKEILMAQGVDFDSMGLN